MARGYGKFILDPFSDPVRAVMFYSVLLTTLYAFGFDMYLGWKKKRMPVRPRRKRDQPWFVAAQKMHARLDRQRKELGLREGQQSHDDNIVYTAKGKPKTSKEVKEELFRALSKLQRILDKSDGECDVGDGPQMNVVGS